MHELTVEVKKEIQGKIPSKGKEKEDMVDVSSVATTVVQGTIISLFLCLSYFILFFFFFLFFFFCFFVCFFFQNTTTTST